MCFSGYVLMGPAEFLLTVLQKYSLLTAANCSLYLFDADVLIQDPYLSALKALLQYIYRFSESISGVDILYPMIYFIIQLLFLKFISCCILLTGKITRYILSVGKLIHGVTIFFDNSMFYSNQIFLVALM